MHTNAWNNSSPLGSEFASSIDNHMRAMKLDVDERMSIAFTWNDSQEFDGYPVSMPFRGVPDTALIYSHAPNTIGGASDAGLIELEQTWNTTGDPTALWINITDTASDPNSKLFDFLVNGISKASLTKQGVFTATGVSFDNVIAGNVVPKAHNLYSLGTPGLWWMSAYIASVTGVSANFSGSVVFNGPVEFNSNVAGGITTDNLHLSGNLTVAGQVDFANGVTAGTLNVAIIAPDGRIPMIHPNYFQDTTGIYLTGVGLLAANNVWTGVQSLAGYSEEHTAVAIVGGALDINLALGSVFEFTLNQAVANTTIAGIPASGRYASFVLLVNTVGAAFSWPWLSGVVRWPGGSIPAVTVTNGRIDKYFFWTRNGGAIWYGSIVAQDYAV